MARIPDEEIERLKPGFASAAGGSAGYRTEAARCGPAGTASAVARLGHEEPWRELPPCGRTAAQRASIAVRAGAHRLQGHTIICPAVRRSCRECGAGRGRARTADRTERRRSLLLVGAGEIYRPRGPRRLWLWLIAGAVAWSAGCGDNRTISVRDLARTP